MHAGKFGERKGSVGVARGAAESNSSFSSYSYTAKSMNQLF